MLRNNDEPNHNIAVPLNPEHQPRIFSFLLRKHQEGALSFEELVHLTRDAGMIASALSPDSDESFEAAETRDESESGVVRHAAFVVEQKLKEFYPELFKEFQKTNLRDHN